MSTFDASILVKIGTSGIVVPGTKNLFPDDFKQSSRLHYYASLFNTLEINSSFYKIPLAKTFERWANEVPDDFRFTVKCWRGITHTKHLEFTNTDIDIFMARIGPIVSKAGCLLIQFPASINFKYLNKVEAILGRISHHNANQQWLLAVEFRHMSWYCDITYSVLNKYKAAIVVHDMPNSATPLNLPFADFIYLRFHGPTGDYKGNYPTDVIESHAKHVIQWKNSGKTIYIYFNNTIGSALDNAQALQKLVY